MGLFFVYILKSSACLTIFYLFYRLLLSRETFHRFNRFALLGILVLSCLLPLIEVSVHGQTEVHQAMMTLEQWLLLADAMNAAEVEVQAQAVTVTWIQVALLLYLLGIFFFIFRNIYSLIRLLMLLKSGTKESISHYFPDRKRVIVIVHESDIAPFSWMKYIVISRKDLEENRREILIHELAHIRNRHSVDLLVADISIFFQWFNPASWLLKQELQNIHEYEADETVIKEGVNAKQYQLLLIKKAVGTRLYSMANSFNHSKLKKRITMMSKEKSSPWARMKYFYILPVAAIAVTAFARPEISDTAKEISAVKVNDLTAIVETKVMESVNALPEVPKVKALVADTTKPAEVKYIPQEVKDQLSGTPVFDVVEKNSSTSNITIRGIATSNGKSPLYIVDGQEVTSSVMSALNPDKIANIKVLKDESSTELYGEKGKNGTILITLKQGTPEVVGNVKVLNSSQNTLDQDIYVDGVKIDLGDRTLNDLMPAEQIKHINVNKNRGEKGEIHITTKKYKDAEKNSAQGNLKVEGKVVDEQGNPVIAATVLLEGTTYGSVTDIDGNFSLSVPSKDAVLIVSYIGMATVKTKAQAKVKVTLKSEQ